MEKRDEGFQTRRNRKRGGAEKRCNIEKRENRYAEIEKREECGKDAGGRVPLDLSISQGCRVAKVAIPPWGGIFMARRQEGGGVPGV